MRVSWRAAGLEAHARLDVCGLARTRSPKLSRGKCSERAAGADRTLADGARWSMAEQRTTLVDISRPGWTPPDAKLLSQIRKAEREGIRVEAHREGRGMQWYEGVWF